jgi:integrase
MKLWKDAISGIYKVRFTVDCQPSECDACKAGTKHTKHTKRFQKNLGKVKGQAEQLALEVIKETKARANGTYIPTLKELRQDWLVANAAEVSIGHWNNVNTWDSQGLDKFKIDRLTNEVVELARGKFRAGKGRAGETRSDATVAGWMRNLNLLLNWAIARKAITTKPYDIAIPKPQKNPKKILPVALVKAWVECVDRHARNPQVGTATRLMAGLGLRESEALGARWEWMDWEAHTYTPGRIVGRKFVTKGKTAVPVDVPGWLYDHLLQLRGEQIRLGLILPWKTLKDGTEIPHPATFTRAAMRAANAEMKTPGVTAHRLRGTWITHLLRRKTPLREVQEMARHAEESTTNSYYELASEVRKEAQEGLAQDMGFGAS